MASSLSSRPGPTRTASADSTADATTSAAAAPLTEPDAVSGSAEDTRLGQRDRQVHGR